MKMIKMVTRFYYTLKDIAALKFETYLDYVGDANDVEVALGRIALEVTEGTFDQR